MVLGFSRSLLLSAFFHLILPLCSSSASLQCQRCIIAKVGLQSGDLGACISALLYCHQHFISEQLPNHFLWKNNLGLAQSYAYYIKSNIWFRHITIQNAGFVGTGISGLVCAEDLIFNQILYEKIKCWWEAVSVWKDISSMFSAIKMRCLESLSWNSCMDIHVCTLLRLFFAGIIICSVG